MDETAKFMIGGQEVVLGPLSIWSLKRCWASINQLSKPIADSFERTEVYCNIISAGMSLTKEISTEELMKRVRWDESLALANGIVDLLRISGFKATEGAADQTAGELQATNNLTETGQASSPNS